MLLRETNEHRRQDLEIQQTRRAIRASRSSSAGKEEEALVHPGSAGADQAVRDGVPRTTFRCAGQDPRIHGCLAFGPFDYQAEHGVSFLAARSEREPQHLVPALPALEGAHPPAGQAHHDAAGGRAPPPDAALDGAQLPNQDPSPDVSLPPYLAVWRALTDCFRKSPVM